MRDDAKQVRWRVQMLFLQSLVVECPALTVSPWIGCGEPLLDEL